MQQLLPRHRFVARLARVVLLLSLLGGLLITLMHLGESDPHPLSRILPPLLTATFAALLGYAWWRPRRARKAIWLGSLATSAVLAVTVVVFLLPALQAGGPRLVETLPPVAPVLLSTLVLLVVFLRPRTALRLGALVWLLVAVPVVAFLLAHPAELQFARGQELLLTLGPASLLLLLLVPYYAASEQRLRALQRSAQRARTLAARDPLTTLFNRRAFEDRLASAIAQSGAGQQLILFDVDHFKAINDRHGHPAGDRVLIEIAARCQALLGRGELLARWGGEEFAVLCRATPQSPGRMAENLREAIGGVPIAPVGAVTASFGVTEVRPGDSLETALGRADEALYRAKQGGRDRVQSG